MKKLIYLTIALYTVLYANAQEADSLLVKANNLYAQAKFDEAIIVYENILKIGYEAPEIYYNLGNAYYKKNVLSQAVLNYEKALLLAPNDEDIQYNLELANRLVVDKIEKLPVFFMRAWVNSWRNIFSSDVWAYISIIAFIVTLLFISFYLYSRRIGFKKLSFSLSFLTLLLCIVSLTFSYQQKQKVISGSTAVIMSPSVTVKSSPDASGTDLFVLHEGTKVWIEDKVSDWQEIKLSDGSKGWLKAENLEVI